MKKIQQLPDLPITVVRILELLEQKGVSARQAETDCGISNSLIYQWKTGKGSPSTEAIIKLAKYFDVSSDYLLGLDTPSQERLVPSNNEIYLIARGGEKKTFKITPEKMAAVEQVLKAMEDKKDK